MPAANFVLLANFVLAGFFVPAVNFVLAAIFVLAGIFVFVCFDALLPQVNNYGQGETDSSPEAVNQYFVSGARVLDSRPSGRGFESHRRRCVVPLSKTYLS